MNHAFLSAAAALAVVPTAIAQTVQFRLVERTGQTFITQGGDTTLDIAIQARVIGGGSLSTFAFDVIMPGEADTSGVLVRGLISNADGTYNNSFASNSVVGRGGLARSYSYLAGISPSFNGVINASVGTFTNTPENQEIGLITGVAAGAALLSTPGMDPLGDGNPATWSGYGMAATPPNGATAALDPTVAGTYFSQGSFNDVYRFRYTVTDFTGGSCRGFLFTLRGVQATVGTHMVYQNDMWALSSTSVPADMIAVTPFQIFPCPSPGAFGVLTMAGGAVAIRRRRG